MRGYDVHEVFYLNYEIHYPLDKGLGPSSGSM